MSWPGAVTNAPTPLDTAQPEQAGSERTCSARGAWSFPGESISSGSSPIKKSLGGLQQLLVWHIVKPLFQHNLQPFGEGRTWLFSNFPARP